MNGGTRLPLRDASLAIALAVSTATHIAVFAALGRIDGGTTPVESRASAPASTTLEARLLTLPVAGPGAPPEALRADSGTASIPAPPDSKNDTALTHALALAKSAPVAPDATRPGDGARERAAMRTPRIAFSAGVPRSRFGGALLNGALDDFPIEVDVDVVAPDRIEIPYPPGALASGREATALAWVVVDENGAVEATHVVDGPPEFADAIEAALATTRFIPARNGGTNIRFYVTFEFEFRLDAPKGAVGAGASAGSR